MPNALCCKCNTTHAVRRRTADPDVVTLERDNDLDWVMDVHNYNGGHCNGSGLLPRMLVTDPKDLSFSLVS